MEGIASSLLEQQRQQQQQQQNDVQSDVVLRSLQEEDFSKGFLQLLTQLTVVGDVSVERFKERCQDMLKSEDYCVLVVEDTTAGLIIGTATLVILRKFIHECGKVGLIEDVVVNSEYRGRKLGHRLIDGLTAVGKERGCYKMMLNCAQSNVGFYTSCGYKMKEVQMVQYFE